jgi:REP element-mobilizing transposase RayT
MSINERIKRAKELDPDGPWRSRGYLPHYDDNFTTQFVTYRLADSLPQKLIAKYRSQLQLGEIEDIEYYRRIELALDKGSGENFLGLFEVASAVEENLLRFDGSRYHLHHWVIMPNHVHLMLTACDGHNLASIVHSLKSFTANRANRILKRKGSFWAVEYFDRYIRNAAHYGNAVSYIHRNPVKAGLCDAAEDWHFGCASRHG